jgi:hypothetical protein
VLPELDNLPVRDFGKLSPTLQLRLHNAKESAFQSAFANLRAGLYPQKDLRLLRQYSFEYQDVLSTLSYKPTEKVMFIVVAFVRTKKSKESLQLQVLRESLPLGYFTQDILRSVFTRNFLAS